MVADPWEACVKSDAVSTAPPGVSQDMKLKHKVTLSKSNPQYLSQTPVGSRSQDRKINKAVMSDLLLLGPTQQERVAAKKDVLRWVKKVCCIPPT